MKMRLMLRQLLGERFGLVVRSERQERKVYALTAAKGGAQLPGTTGTWRFTGDMPALAGILAMQLSIPFQEDPTKPGRATGSPTPVVNRTGIEGATISVSM